MRMLLDHTDGLLNGRWLTHDKKLSIYFKPGSRFAYSGEGIDLAQMVVETVTKKSSDELLNEHIFQPLGMACIRVSSRKNHWTMIGQIGTTNLTNGWLRNNGEGEMQLASTHTTLRDYSLFVQAGLKWRDSQQEGSRGNAKPGIEVISKHEFPTLSKETTTENRAIRLSTDLVGFVETCGARVG
jgi:CubicO group peptidase (beta-lactamase class C family)